MTFRTIMALGVLSWALSAQPAQADDTNKAQTPRQTFMRQGPAVVLIIASDDQKTGSSLGTGSIISSDGLVLTNNHVIYSEDAKRPFKEVHVFLKPAKVTGEMKNDLQHHFVAKVLKNDPNLDLALLKIDDVKDLPKIEFGDSEELLPGDSVVAIGHPEGGGFWTLTTGAIGTTFNNYRGIAGKNVFQMETSLNRGNSGGPLIDPRGYQVGVNSFIVRQGEGGLAITGVNFSLRSSAVKAWLEKNANVQVAYGGKPLPGADGESAVAAAKEPPRSTAAGVEPPPDVPADTASKANVSRKSNVTAPAAASAPASAPPSSSSGVANAAPAGKGGRVGKAAPTRVARRQPIRLVDDRTAEEKRPHPFNQTRMLSGFAGVLQGIQGDAGKAQSDMDRKMDAFRRRKKH